MHEIAEPSTVAFTIFVLPAARLAKVCDGRQFGVERATSIPAFVEIIHSCLGLRFPFVSGIDISNQVVSNVVAHMQLQQVPKLGELTVQIFIHGIETLLELLLCELADGVVRGVVVDIGE